MALYRKAAIMLSLLLACSAAGCTLGKGSSANEGDPTPSEQPPNTDPPETDPPEQDPPEEDPPVDPPAPSYEYGENWSDPYDADYTRSLLSMGDQAFTLSQLSGVDYFRRTRTPNSGNKEGKYVGIFYFLWQNEGNGLYDISKLLEKYDPTDVEKNPLWAIKGGEYYDPNISPMSAFHYFEEPLYGYYASTDKWVIMRHLELLTYAGVDFLYLDYTNANSADPEKEPGNIYPAATYALLDSILELQKKGIDCPKIVPLICNPYTSGKDVSPNQRRANVVQWVYKNYYAKDNFKYKSCWFTADKTHNPSGKPLLVSYTIDRNDFADKAAYDAFWFRDVVWPTMVNGGVYENGFPWMDYELPQANYNGFMNISVAQHLGGSWSSEAYLAQSRGTGTMYRGRGAKSSDVLAADSADVEDAIYGINFNDQWRNALNATGDREPWVLTVTGWNEWTAQKLDQGLGRATFVDTFSIAFSRDAEMMRDKNGYSDNFYMQIAANTAKFKAKPSTRKSDAAMWQRTSLMIDDLAAWELVEGKYLDLSGDAMNRDKDSVGHVYHYTDDSARNDIEYLKFANDSENLYVLVSTKDNVTPYEEGDGCWMNLYLSTTTRGWQGYDFVINRSPDGKTTSIEALSEDEEGKIVATLLEARAEYFVKDNFIAFSIPLEAIGVTSKDVIGIKACDNIFGVKRTESDGETPGNDGVGVYQFGDIEAFYCGGDCAPIGRLNYSYRLGY